jgi:uncharacterized membrane protein
VKAFDSISSGLLLRIIFSFAIITWCAGFSFVQIFPQSNPVNIILPFVKYSYSIVCHQDGDKSFLINGMQLFVCARCTGIYAGALLTSLVVIFIKKLPLINLKIASLSLFPIIIDIVLYNSGLYSYSKTVAFITGLFPGSVLFIYILSSFEKFFKELSTFNG